MAVNIIGHTVPKLTELVQQWGGKPFRARQLMRWIHQRGISSFDEMTDLAREFRAQLTENCVVNAPPVSFEHVSNDGTRKWLFDIDGSNAIEAVFIPEDDRGTLCVSSQAGCAVACPFCSTGYQGFNRNLTTDEIIGQLWYAQNQLSATPQSARLQSQDPTPHTSPNPNKKHKPTNVPTRMVSNIVFMGMGEPLLNYDNVLGALQIMLDDNAYGLSRRRVTVSTSGVVPMMDRLANDCPVALAVSLHAPNDELRDKLVSLNKKYPLKELLAACNRYLLHAPRDFVTFEYIMLSGINDTVEHAKQLIEITKIVRCKINLIPFNPFPQSGLQRSSNNNIHTFAKILSDAGVITTTRKTRGDDIAAACGQLAGDVKDRTRIAKRLPNRAQISI